MNKFEQIFSAIDRALASPEVTVATAMHLGMARRCVLHAVVSHVGIAGFEALQSMSSEAWNKAKGHTKQPEPFDAAREDVSCHWRIAIASLLERVPERAIDHLERARSLSCQWCEGATAELTALKLLEGK